MRPLRLIDYRATNPDGSQRTSCVSVSHHTVFTDLLSH
jgi:hypothetical protein